VAKIKTNEVKMKKVIFKEKYHVMTKEIMKSATSMTKVEDFIDFYRQKIEAHPVTIFIGTFDHYSHTKGLADGEVAPEILAAQHIIFCFGKELPSPIVMGVRPRSFGISELSDRFIVSFQEAPKALANDAMMKWTDELAA